MIKLFPEPFINAIFEALLYSLAFGILLALVTGGIVLSTRKVSARIRHNLLLAALGLFILAVFGSFIQQLIDVDSISFFRNRQGDTQPTQILFDNTTGGKGFPAIASFFHSYADLIVLIWCLVVVVKAFQLMTGLQSLSGLKQKNIKPVSELLQERADLIARKLSIDRVVRVMASGITKVPMVVGYLKPIILLPAGLIVSLSPESLEAILVHELAHIRRRDWLINLLLNAVEIIFFFNPAVLWVATLIRAERENCCDDIAIAYTGCKAGYIDTLVACEEYQLASTRYALAFGGRKKPLLERVKRMLSNRNSSLSSNERIMVVVSIVLALITVVAFSANSLHLKRNLDSSPASAAAHDIERLIRSNDRTNDSSEYIKRMFVDHDDKLLSEMVRRDSLRLLNDSIAYELHKIATNTQDGTHQGLGSLQSEKEKLSRLDEQLKTARREELTGGLENLNKKLNKLDSDVDELSDKRIDIPVSIKTNYPVNIKSYENSGNYSKSPQYDIPESKSYNNPDLNGLIAALITTGAITHKDELKSFKLSDTEFIMNNTRMSDEVYLPLRKAFVPDLAKGHWAWMYNYKT